MFEDFMLYIQQNAETAPWLIFGLLLLAGLNIPVSEDGMLVLSAWLASQRPDLTASLFLGVYAGAYFSDIICYWLGRLLGPKLWRIRWFAKMVSAERVEQISGFYGQYGVLTLLLGRFVPFGFRNALFLTAGLGRMHFGRFAVADLFAATISCGVYFWLYLTYGETVIEYVKRSNVAIFAAVAIVASLLLIRRWRRKRASEAALTNDPDDGADLSSDND